jgi:hypothetical protein
MFRLMAAFLFALATGWSSVAAWAQEPVPVGVHHQTVWVPDFYGSLVNKYVTDFTTSPPTFVASAIDVSSYSCNPNSVAIKGARIYVVCNSDYGGPDEILVFNDTTFNYVKTIDGTGPSGAGGTFPYFSGSGLIGIAFDMHGNLWVTGYGANSLYRIPLAELSSASPQIDRQVVDSPDLPAGITFTAAGAAWVVGQYGGGILVKFPDSVINGPGTFLHNSPDNLNPQLCLSNILTDCHPTSGLFNNPEGVAVFDGAVWVSNNGGNAPGRKLVRAVPEAGQAFATSKYGHAANAPFSCPGGLFTSTLAGATPELWVNDEGFGFENGTCGSSSATQGSGVGLVHAFTASDLLNNPTAPTPEAFKGAAKLKTGSPGFGGVFVQLD